MVKSRLCETARLAFFSARPRHMRFLKCEIETLESTNYETELFHLTPQATLSSCSLSITKDCETALRKKSRLRDLTLLKKRDSETALRKKSRLQDHKSAEKTRLRDPWNLAKILRDPDFLKDHSPPLKVKAWTTYHCFLPLKGHQDFLKSYFKERFLQDLPNEMKKNIESRAN